MSIAACHYRPENKNSLRGTSISAHCLVRYSSATSVYLTKIRCCAVEVLLFIVSYNCLAHNSLSVDHLVHFALGLLLTKHMINLATDARALGSCYLHISSISLPYQKYQHTVALCWCLIVFHAINHLYTHQLFVVLMA